MESSRQLDLTVCSHCSRELEQRLQPCEKSWDLWPIQFERKSRGFATFSNMYVRDVSPAVSPQWNSLLPKKHKKSKESGIWTSYFIRKLHFYLFFFLSFFGQRIRENELLRTLNMSCGKLRKRTKSQHLAGQLYLSVRDKMRHQRFSRTLKNTGKKKVSLIASDSQCEMHSEDVWIPCTFFQILQNKEKLPDSFGISLK